MTTIDAGGETAASEKRTGLRRRYVQGAAIASGLMMAGSFPHLDWGWLTWFGLIPFLLILSDPQLRLRGALAMSFTFGVVYFGGLLYWLGICGAHVLGPGLGVLAWVIAVMAQTLVMLMFGAGGWWLARRPNAWAWMVGVPALWTVLEWVRQLGQLGTTWGDISVAQHANLQILQISKLTGPWGVTFLVAMVNMLIVERIRMRRDRRGAEWTSDRSSFAVIVALLLFSSIAYGASLLHSERLQPTFKVAALQPSIDPNVEWSDSGRPADPNYVESTMKAYIDRGTSSGAQVVVWPETVFPGYLRDDPILASAVVAEARSQKQTLLVGTPERYPLGGPEGNALTVVSPTGIIGNSYLKRHLVPWGEYVPFRKLFPILSALHLTLLDRKFGDPVQPLFQSPEGPLGSVICYESSYPELTREEVARGAGLLAIVTDDTWYGRTAAPYQHANFAVLRAVENDRYVVRAAATGISVIVDPDGRVIAQAPLFTPSTVVADVEARHNLTFYARHGDWFVWMCIGLIVVLASIGRKREG